MRSYRSVAIPETCPRIQLFGNGLGQNGSTWNCGTALTFWAEVWVPHMATAMTNDAISILTFASHRGYYGPASRVRHRSRRGASAIEPHRRRSRQYLVRLES